MFPPSIPTLPFPFFLLLYDLPSSIPILPFPLFYYLLCPYSSISFTSFILSSSSSISILPFLLFPLLHPLLSLLFLLTRFLYSIPPPSLFSYSLYQFYFIISFLCFSFNSLLLLLLYPYSPIPYIPFTLFSSSFILILLFPSFLPLQQNQHSLHTAIHFFFSLYS